MKAYRLLHGDRIGRHWPPLLVVGAAAGSLFAAETNAPPATATNAPPPVVTNAASAKAAEAPALTPEQMFEGGTNVYNNWIELGGGGFITSGSKPQFQQQQQARGGVFGGIEDLHLQNTFTNGLTLTLDGRAVVDENDYKARVELMKEKLGYVRFSFDQFRTWYNADGGFFPLTGLYFADGGSALALDRGDISFEAGLTLDKLPKVVFKYDHTYREGQKSSTIWGITHPTANSGLARGLAPAYYEIDEHSDIFQLDATHHIKATDLGVGLRYETGQLDDALKYTQSPGEPLQRSVSDQQNNNYDLLNVHASSETWIKKNLMFSFGGSFSDLDNDFSGSRVYGSDFQVGFVPALANGVGYFDLGGGSHLYEYIGDVNLFYKPWPNFSIVPSVRVQKEDTDATGNGLQTSGITAPSPFTGCSDWSDLDVRERLDLTYNGITNWVLYARGELAEGDGNLSENGGIPRGAPVNLHQDEDRFFQKYSAGARWYAARGVTLDGGGYYKRHEYDYENTHIPPDFGDHYPGFLTTQNFDTYDGNVRLALRPFRNVSTISRYEFQYSAIDTTPDPASGVGEVMSSKMTSHILAQDINWTPWSRLYLQAGVNYVWSKTHTPASDFTAAVLDAQNNYYTVNAASGLVLDDRTDLRVAYVYYRADDYHDNSLNGVPYGAGGEDHSITATLTRRISSHLRWTLKYGFTHYTDQLYGGNRDFEAHLVYSGLQYRF